MKTTRMNTTTKTTEGSRNWRKAVGRGGHGVSTRTMRKNKRIKPRGQEEDKWEEEEQEQQEKKEENEIQEN